MWARTELSNGIGKVLDEHLKARLRLSRCCAFTSLAVFYVNQQILQLVVGGQFASIRLHSATNRYFGGFARQPTEADEVESYDRPICAK